MVLQGEDTASLVARCREMSPLVQCITNFVSMDLMANVLLAAGASPAMAHSIGEVEAFMRISSALLVNVGTLSEDWVGGMKLAAIAADRLGKPWVLDPVGCGATPARTKLCKELLALKPAVVRGNASEILALGAATGKTQTRGVDSSHGAEDALPAARAIASLHSCVVAVSGEVDFVTDGDCVAMVHNGDALLQAITATGCSVTALIAAFVVAARGTPESDLVATAHALAFFNVAAEAALERLPKPVGPGSFRVGLLDQLYLLRGEDIASRAKFGVYATRSD